MTPETTREVFPPARKNLEGPESTRARPTPAELFGLLAYEATTGQLTWRASGKRAGSNLRGYIRLMVAGQRLFAHRVAWCLHHGEWPELQVDHINGDRSDNRIANLRLATNAQNQCNAGLSPRNTSGFKGVSFHRPYAKWRASINEAGRRRTLGHFETPEAAHAAYSDAAHRIYGEFARPEARSNRRRSEA